MAPYKGGQRSGRKSPSKPKAPSRRPVRSSDPRPNLPGGRSKPKPSAKPTRQGPAIPTRLQNAPSAPKLPAPTRTTASRPVAARPAAKPKAPAKAKPPMAPKAPKTDNQTPGYRGNLYEKTFGKPSPRGNDSAPKPPVMPAAQSSFGPVKSGKEYGKMISAPKPPKASAVTSKQKTKALTQAEIRKRRLN
jgi:hypothetical protein